MKDDRQLQREVLAEIEQAGSVPAGSIGVEVHHGVVKLAVKKTDSAATQNAELVARRVPGVTNVVLDMGIRTC